MVENTNVLTNWSTCITGMVLSLTFKHTHTHTHTHTRVCITMAGREYCGWLNHCPMTSPRPFYKFLLALSNLIILTYTM